MLTDISAHCTLESISPYCQSRYHGEAYLEGETHEAYDMRTWRHHLHVKDGTVIIPARAILDCLIDAAKYSKRQIPGQGRATWTQKFASGLVLFEDIKLGISPDVIDYVPVYCNADGKRGGGTRVLRRFPIIPAWRAGFTISILDPILIEDIFVDILEQAGMFIGIGQNRPQNRGTHGRFRIVKVDWLGAAQPDLRRRRAA